MVIIDPAYIIMNDISDGGVEELKLIERVARVCYQSETGKTFEDTKAFIRRLIKRKHFAMIEHSFLSVMFECDRGISHEVVRHRIGSFAQESTRWCNYSKDRFGNGITVIDPGFDRNGIDHLTWKRACLSAEDTYMKMVNSGISPQKARGVLPHALKTSVVLSTNYREWRHFFELRCAADAHPQLRELATKLLHDLNGKIPVIFEDLAAKYPLQETY